MQTKRIWVWSVPCCSREREAVAALGTALAEFILLFACSAHFGRVGLQWP